MKTRDDKEYNKFDLDLGNVAIKAVEGDSPATALFSGNIDELESKKFTANGSIRIITTF